jgi:predicted DNA-binding WGR domain protein
VTMKRYLEFVGQDTSRGVESSSKFWEAWVEAETLHTRFGKIGAKGQTTIKAFPSAAEAELALKKAVAAKLKKGYGEKASEGVDAVATDLSPGEEVQLEIARCVAPGTSPQEINSILDSHEGCTDWEGKCWICIYLEDDDQDMPDELWGENIFVALSRRSDLTRVQQDRIVQAGRYGAPMDVHLAEILPNLAEFSESVSAEAKEVMLAPFECVSSGFDDFGVYESWARDLLDKLRANDSFSSADIEQFLDHHAEYDFDFRDRDDEDVKAAEEDANLVCTSCGKELPQGARFCTECGGKAAPVTMTCAQCDEELEPTDRFCGGCGTPTAEDEPEPESEPEYVVPIARWMMDAIDVLPRNRKIRRLDFLAGAQSTLVFSIECSGEDFDVRLNNSVLDLDVLIGPGYPDFTDEDPVEPDLFIHAYWGVEDFEGLGPEIMEDIVRMSGSQEWVKSTTITGVMREKVEVERWGSR